MEDDKIIVENILDYDEKGREINGDLHIKANYTGISFDFVYKNRIIKSAWLTCDDIFELMQMEISVEDLDL
jgi:hypothetical protein